MASPISANDIVTQMRQALAITEPELDTTVGTTVRKILDVVGEVVAEAYVDRYLIDYQYDINVKFGTDLDDFVQLFGFTRLPAKRATGTITFQRASAATANINIPVGTQVATAGANPQIFSTIVPGLIVVGQTTIEVPVQAVVGGVAGNVAAHTINRRVTPIEGVNSFDNAVGMTGGSDAESDDQLRHRFKRTIFRNLAGTEQMFLGVALDDPSVTLANVIGATKRRREQVEVVSGEATSTIGNAKYIYLGSFVVGPSIDEGDILTENVHYTVDAEAFLLASPGAPVLTQSGTGGTLGAATYSYRVSATNDYGETEAGTADDIVVAAGTTNRVILNWTAVPGATGYRVYGRTTGSEELIAVLGNVTTYNDTGSVTPSGDPPDANTAGLAPVITAIDPTAMPDGIYELEFEYVPMHSRNDPTMGVTNRVDVYVNGSRPTEATETVMFRTSRTFSNTTGDPLDRSRFRRLDDTKPVAGNYFVQFAFAPVLDPSTTNQIVIGATTYEEGTDYFLVNDISENGGTSSSFSGIEWVSLANGATETVPADLTEMVVTYTFNAVIRDVETAVRAWRLITTDARVHQARSILLNLYFAVILSPGFSSGVVTPMLEAALSEFIDGIGFNGFVQVSDLLAVAHSVDGVDAVRFLTSTDDPTNYAIQRVSAAETVLETYAVAGRATDVRVNDNEVPVLNDVEIVVKAQNTFGSV